jgi:mono/diheme cytochrome c family protein
MERGRVAWVTGVLIACAAGMAAQQTPSVEAGRRVYEHEKCAACHQIAKQGNSRYPLDGVASRLTADQLRRWITDTAAMEAALPRLPAIRMSAQKYRIKAADLDALVAYLQTLK